MFIVGGTEKHGKVNSVFKFDFPPEIDESTLKSDICNLGDLSEQKSFNNFEIGGNYLPSVLVKLRAPNLPENIKLSTQAAKLLVKFILVDEIKISGIEPVFELIQWDIEN